MQTQSKLVRRLITVWRDKFVAGWNGEDEIPSFHPSRGLVAALEDSYATDAHWVPYAVELIKGGAWTLAERAPRVNIQGLARLKLEHARLVFFYGVADVDCAEAHASEDGEAPEEWRVAMRALAEVVVPGCMHYDTQRGLRIVWAWASGLDEIAHMRKMAAALTYLRDAGIPADELKDFGRCYRVPFGVRNGVKQDRPARICEPAVWEAPAPVVAQPAQPMGLWDTIDAVREPFALPDAIVQGERHNVLKSYAASLRARGYNRDEIEVALREVDLQRCDPPLQGTSEEHQIPDLLDWVCKFPPGPSTQAVGRPTVPPPTETVTIPKEAFEHIFKKGDEVEIADWVLSWIEQDCGRFCVADRGGLFRGNTAKGLWLKIDDKELNDRILASHLMNVLVRQSKTGPVYAPLSLSSKKIDGVKDIMLRRRDDTGFFSDAVPGIAFRDLFVTVDKTGVRFLPHDLEHRCTTGYDFNWTDDPPVTWLAALESYWASYALADRAEMVQTLGEWLGATLLGVSWRFKKIVWLYGEHSDGGKSTVLNTALACFPPGSTTAILPQALGNPREVAALATSKLNVCDDISPHTITAAAAKSLKNLAGGDRMRGVPLFRSGFDFDSRCGVLLSMNTLPPTEDRGGAYFDRLLIFPFPDKIKNPDRGFAKKLAAERDKIVCWSLRCAAKLLARGHYLDNGVISRMRQDYAFELDDVAQWVEEETVPVGHANGLTPTDAYNAYRLWAERNGVESLTGRIFGKRLKVKVGEKALTGPQTLREWRYPIALVGRKV